MALGFTFTEYDEWRMLVCKDRAKKFMKNFGKAREIKINQFANINNMVAPPVLTRTDEEINTKWTTVKGIKGYKFAINGEELQCLNTKTDECIRGAYGDYGQRLRFVNQDNANSKDNSLCAAPLKIAFCIKHNININHKKLVGKKFKGTLQEPVLRADKKGELLWDILNNPE